MTAQQLKNAILQEAIQGRLVPQDPNDEPASALLERILKEKEELVKEGKLKKKDLEVIPISEDEIPFEIPESWEWVRLITLSKLIHYGYTASASPKGNSKLLRITDIQDDKVNWMTVPFCTIKDNDLEKYQLHNRDILIARTGGTIGKTYIVRELNDVAVFASYLIRAIPLENVYEEYLKLFMGSPCYWSQLTDAASGTGQPNVNGQSLSILIVPLPPVAEQKRIVAKIEELLPKVEAYGKAQESLDKLNEELPERLKKSILQEAIEGRLVPQDPNDEPASALLAKIREEKKQLVKEGKLKKKDLEEKPISEEEIPFEIPESWEWVRIKTIFDVCSARRVHEKDWRTSGIPFYRAREIGKLADNGFVDNDLFIDQQLYDEFSQSGVPKEGDLMITAVGTLGKVYIVKEGEIFYYKDGSVLCMENKWRINPQYAKYVIESPVFINQYIGESQGTTVATLTMVRVNQYLFPLPPLAEQKRIVAKIEEVFKEIDKLKNNG